MTSAVVALPAGSPVAVLSTALSQVPEAQLVALLDSGTAMRPSGGGPHGLLRHQGMGANR